MSDVNKITKMEKCCNQALADGNHSISSVNIQISVM